MDDDLVQLDGIRWRLASLVDNLEPTRDETAGAFAFRIGRLQTLFYGALDEFEDVLQNLKRLGNKQDEPTRAA